MDFAVTIRAKVHVEFGDWEPTDEQGPPEPEDVRAAIVQAIDDSDLAVVLDDDDDTEFETTLELEDVSVVEV